MILSLTDTDALPCFHSYATAGPSFRVPYINTCLCILTPTSTGIPNCKTYLLLQHVVEPSPVAVVHESVMKDAQAFVAPQANDLLFLGDQICTPLKYALTGEQAATASRRPATIHANSIFSKTRTKLLQREDSSPEILWRDPSS